MAGKETRIIFHAFHTFLKQQAIAGHYFGRDRSNILAHRMCKLDSPSSIVPTVLICNQQSHFSIACLSSTLFKLKLCSSGQPQPSLQEVGHCKGRVATNFDPSSCFELQNANESVASIFFCIILEAAAASCSNAMVSEDKFDGGCNTRMPGSV